MINIWNHIRNRKARITYKQAYAIAKKYGLEEDYLESIYEGCSPEAALAEWDLLDPKLIDTEK